ncbi:MAG TPA: PAS domain-containing sensor histidine kinase [Gemmatimonadaceae bacterium]|nr:PAS domain-containing sensor histidine kinase [Gemmatimonadaceae bacterium]
MEPVGEVLKYAPSVNVDNPTDVHLEDAALPKGTDLYRILVQGVQDYAIYALTPDGVIASWNAGAQRLKGYTSDEILGRHLSEFYAPEDRDACWRALNVARAEGRFEGEGWRVRKDGTRFWANVLITTLYDEKGHIVGFAKVTRDLTERREAEARRIADAARLAGEATARRDAQITAAQLGEANARLERATALAEAARREAEAARAEASAANEAKSKFLAVMSHEIRTPVNAIVGYTELIADEITGSLNDAQRHQIERVRTSARHLLAVIQNILTLSRLEAGKETVYLACADARELVRESADLIAPLAKAKGLRFDVHLTNVPCQISTDATKVRQILTNLLSNAVKFTDRGSVSLSVHDGDGAVRVCVRDTGVGIESALLPRVFDAYWRADDTANRVSGTGLGLSVAQRLAESLGGSITVESEPGAGSTFVLQLPRH